MAHRKYCVDHRLSSFTQRALVCQVKGPSGLQDGETDPQKFTCQRDQRHILRFALLNQSAIVLGWSSFMDEAD